MWINSSHPKNYNVATPTKSKLSRRDKEPSHVQHERENFHETFSGWGGRSKILQGWTTLNALYALGFCWRQFIFSMSWISESIFPYWRHSSQCVLIILPRQGIIFSWNYRGICNQQKYLGREQVQRTFSVAALHLAPDKVYILFEKPLIRCWQTWSQAEFKFYTELLM